MTAGLMADITAAAARVDDARSTHARGRAVAGFVRVLASVPDEAANSVSPEQARAIGSLSEHVIDVIEAHAADAGNAQALVAAVYEIRRLLEEIDVWRRHYSAARTS